MKYLIPLLLLCLPAYADNDGNCDQIVTVADFLLLRNDLNKQPIDRCLNWSMITKNEDGSPIDDLAGYNVWCKNKQLEDPWIVATINDPSVTRWFFPTAMTGYFMCNVRGFDNDGNELEISDWFSVDRRRLEP